MIWKLQNEILKLNFRNNKLSSHMRNSNQIYFYWWNIAFDKRYFEFQKKMQNKFLPIDWWKISMKKYFKIRQILNMIFKIFLIKMIMETSLQHGFLKMSIAFIRLIRQFVTNAWKNSGMLCLWCCTPLFFIFQHQY